MLRGAVADLRDADELAQMAVDEAEAKSRCCRFGGGPRPLKGRPSRQPISTAGITSWRNSSTASPVKPISLPVARNSRANIPKPCRSRWRTPISRPGVVCYSSQTDPSPIQRIAS